MFMACFLMNMDNTNLSNKTKTMKYPLALLIAIFFCLQIQAQNDPKKEENTEETEEKVLDTTAVYTLNKTIKALYSSISGEKEEKRNWKQFHYLFKPEAKMVVSHLNDDFVYDTRYLSPKDYKKTSEKWMMEHGFIEKEIHRKVEHFGNIVHVFSTYEAFYSNTDEEPFMRGVNSIQLFYDGTRWWIVNIMWAQENDENPIPKKYLP